MQKITSFTIDHTKLEPGLYVSRIDGDITTYDLRTKKPNTNNLMDNETMHTVEHMLATFLRNSEIKEKIIELFNLEQLERSTGYIRRCTPMNPHFGSRTEEEILEYAKSRLNSDFEWGRLAAENYIAHRDEIPKMKEELKKLVFKL